MHPTGLLVLATAAFLVTHFVSATPLRGALITAMGEGPYRGVYSLVAFVTLGAMIWAYVSAAPGAPYWSPLRLAPLVLMPFALLALVAGLRRNPTLAGTERLLAGEDPARGMIRVTRHPVMWGIMLWAIAHLLANPDLPSLVFFGGFLFVAAAGSIAQDRRNARSAPADWQRFAALTSHLPFVAIAQGRNRLALGEIGWLAPLVAAALYIALILLHPWLFGARAY